MPFNWFDQTQGSNSPILGSFLCSREKKVTTQNVAHTKMSELQFFTVKLRTLEKQSTNCFVKSRSVWQEEGFRDLAVWLDCVRQVGLALLHIFLSYLCIYLLFFDTVMKWEPTGNWQPVLLKAEHIKKMTCFLVQPTGLEETPRDFLGLVKYLKL